MTLLLLFILSCDNPPMLIPTLRPLSWLFAEMVFIFKPPVNPKSNSWELMFLGNVNKNKRKIERDSNLFLWMMMCFIDKNRFTISNKKSHLTNCRWLLILFVVSRGFEPLLPGWKPDVLTRLDEETAVFCDCKSSKISFSRNRKNNIFWFFFISIIISILTCKNIVYNNNCFLINIWWYSKIII